MHTTELVRLVERDPFLVAHIDGEIDLSNVCEIETELTNALPNSARGLIIDLSDVSFIDSTGIRFLFELATKLAQRQQQLRLAVPEGSNLSRTLRLVQMPEMVPVFEDVDRAAAEDAPS